MRRNHLFVFIMVLLAGCAQMQSPPGSTQTVKITPLGSHDGEFCPLDRALIFEDPDGTRVLYDAGRTVRGPNDPRLGRIDAILVSHVHGDHLGDLKAAKMPVHVPLSGRTMQFDGSGRCVSGC